MQRILVQDGGEGRTRHGADAEAAFLLGALCRLLFLLFVFLLIFLLLLGFLSAWGTLSGRCRLSPLSNSSIIGLLLLLLLLLLRGQGLHGHEEVLIPINHFGRVEADIAAYLMIFHFFMFSTVPALSSFLTV